MPDRLHGATRPLLEQPELEQHIGRIMLFHEHLIQTSTSFVTYAEP